MLFPRDETSAPASLAMMSPEALGRLLDEHGPALVLYARQWCASAEDVVQEALVKLVGQRLAPQRLLPWLYRVVRNGAISAGRAEMRRRRHESQAAFEQAAWFQTASEGGLDAEAVAAALQELPAEPREVITLHLWGGLSFEQIAEVAGCSSSTAHRWYHAGLHALRERLNVPCPSDKRRR